MFYYKDRFQERWDGSLAPVERLTCKTRGCANVGVTVKDIRDSRLNSFLT